MSVITVVWEYEGNGRWTGEDYDFPIEHKITVDRITKGKYSWRLWHDEDQVAGGQEGYLEDAKYSAECALFHINDPVKS